MPVFLALASMLAICTYRYIAVCTPLQRFYLMTYIRSGLRSATTFAKTGQYELLAATTKKKSHWAYDGEVAEAKTESGEATVTLTQEALKTGDLHLVLLPVQADDANMHEFLRHAIYRDQTLTDLLHPALWGPLAALLLWVAFPLVKDAARARERPEGGRLKGSELVAPQVFNRRTHSDGLGFELSGEKLPVVGLPKKHPTYFEGPVEVKTEVPTKPLTTALSAEDGVERKITRQEGEQGREHQLSRRPARKERYFQ
jgi:hypothetical protein